MAAWSITRWSSATATWLCSTCRPSSVSPGTRPRIRTSTARSSRSRSIYTNVAGGCARPTRGTSRTASSDTSLRRGCSRCRNGTSRRRCACSKARTAGIREVRLRHGGARGRRTARALSAPGIPRCWTGGHREGPCAAPGRHKHGGCGRDELDPSLVSRSGVMTRGEPTARRKRSFDA
jgi:hypothetical protein